MNRYIVKTQVVMNHYDVVVASSEDAAVDAVLTSNKPSMFFEVDNIKSIDAFEVDVESTIASLFEITGEHRDKYIDRIIKTYIIEGE